MGSRFGGGKGIRLGSFPIVGCRILTPITPSSRLFDQDLHLHSKGSPKRRNKGYFLLKISDIGHNKIILVREDVLTEGK